MLYIGLSILVWGLIGWALVESGFLKGLGIIFVIGLVLLLFWWLQTFEYGWILLIILGGYCGYSDKENFKFLRKNKTI